MIPRKRASILLATLWMIAIFLILCASLLKIAHGDLRFKQSELDVFRARQMCLSGLAHVQHLLTYQPGFHSDLARSLGKGSYEVWFQTPNSYLSVNNLLSDRLSIATNLQGMQVRAGEADVVIVGRWNSVRKALQARLTGGFTLNRSAASEGTIRLGDNAVIDGIRSLSDSTPSQGGLATRHVSRSASDPSVQVGTLNVEFRGQTQVLSPAPAGGLAVQGSVPASRVQTRLPEPIPDLDVSRLVGLQARLPLLASLRPTGSSYQVDQPLLTENARVDRDLVIQGDLRLEGASLYVKGDVTINGGVVGDGSLICDGKVSIQGGVSSLRTSQRGAPSLMATGDIRLTGLNSEGYLGSLAEADPNIAAAQQNLKGQLESVERDLLTGSPTLTRSWQAIGRLSRPQDPANIPVTRGQPLLSPNGARADVDVDHPLLNLASAIRRSRGTSFAGDAKAQQIVRALEQTSYDCRASYSTRESLVDPVTYVRTGAVRRISGWDDTPRNLQGLLVDSDAAWPESDLANYAYLIPSLSFDRQYRALIGTLPDAQLAQLAPYLQPLAGDWQRRLQGFIKAHPTDLSWLGKSQLQGVVYTKRNLVVSNQFELYGGAIAQGGISISDHCKLVYVEDLMRGLAGAGPVQVVWRQEVP